MKFLNRVNGYSVAHHRSERMLRRNDLAMLLSEGVPREKGREAALELEAAASLNTPMKASVREVQTI